MALVFCAFFWWQGDKLVDDKCSMLPYGPLVVVLINFALCIFFDFLMMFVDVVLHVFVNW